MNSLTPDEKQVIDDLVNAWNNFLKLPIEHGDDVHDFRQNIHHLQRQIMCRPIRREMK